MSRLLRAVRARLAGADRHRGFTLVETLVATGIFLTLTALLLTTAMTSVRTTRNSQIGNDLNEEARLVLNRMSRELREAIRVTDVDNPNGSAFNASSDNSVTFEVDFNGNGVIEPSADDPEVITYAYDYAAKQLLLKASGEAIPILAANVSKFRLSFTSRLYDYDADVDGVVTWEELDSDATGIVGNSNGVLDLELRQINSVTIEFTVLTGSRQQVYRTQVDLRNKPQ